jgi:hypothetical protein
MSDSYNQGTTCMFIVIKVLLEIEIGWLKNTIWGYYENNNKDNIVGLKLQFVWLDNLV